MTQVRPASAPLHLGRLAGNHFDLVVRHLRLHADGDRQGGGQRGVADAVERAVENIKVRVTTLQEPTRRSLDSGLLVCLPSKHLGRTV